MCTFKILLAGDSAISVEFGNVISEDISMKVLSLNNILESQPFDGILETIPSYRSLLLEYNPEIINFHSLSTLLKSLMSNLENQCDSLREIIEIPVLYGDEFGQDIETVATVNNKLVDEVIKIHSSKLYLIYMLGFTPGFPYLGGVSDEIATPRLTTPRLSIPEGSVGIAGTQTGIYPITSPGGWQIIGRTPLRLYDEKIESPILLKAGQYIRFVPITKEEFYNISEKAKNHTYECITYKEDVYAWEF